MRFFFLLKVISIVARIGAAFSVFLFVDGREVLFGLNSVAVAMAWSFAWTLLLLWPELVAEARSIDRIYAQNGRYQYACDIDGGKHFDLKTWDPTDPTIYGTHADPINGPSGPQ